MIQIDGRLPMDRDAEIEQVRHELEMLRERYALYERFGRMLRVFFMIWIPLFVPVFAALVFKLFAYDTFMAVFVIAMVLAIAILLWLLRDHNRSTIRGGQGRWVDLASLPMSGFSLDLISSPGSDERPQAQVVEEQIATRERRLTELGVPS